MDKNTEQTSQDIFEKKSGFDNEEMTGENIDDGITLEKLENDNMIDFEKTTLNDV
jgi:hypothetical protein